MIARSHHHRPQQWTFVLFPYKKSTHRRDNKPDKILKWINVDSLQLQVHHLEEVWVQTSYLVLLTVRIDVGWKLLIYLLLVIVYDILIKSSDLIWIRNISEQVLLI